MKKLLFHSGAVLLLSCYSVMSLASSLESFARYINSGICKVDSTYLNIGIGIDIKEDHLSIKEERYISDRIYFINRDIDVNITKLKMNRYVATDNLSVYTITLHCKGVCAKVYKTDGERGSWSLGDSFPICITSSEKFAFEMVRALSLVLHNATVYKMY